jgi:hypothetical protein
MNLIYIYLYYVAEFYRSFERWRGKVGKFLDVIKIENIFRR